MLLRILMLLMLLWLGLRLLWLLWLLRLGLQLLGLLWQHVQLLCLLKLLRHFRIDHCGHWVVTKLWWHLRRVYLHGCLLRLTHEVRPLLLHVLDACPLERLLLLL